MVLAKGKAGAMANKYTYLYVVQGQYGHGWEDLTAATSRKEANVYARDYRENDGSGPIRVIMRRELNTAK